MDYEFDLGSHCRTVTTSSEAAQKWFDRGLAWTYGFNHEEAVACFKRAIAADPDCAMAWWGVSYAIGPNYNKPWEAFDEEDLAASLKAACEAANRACELSGECSAAEISLIGALPSRYQSEIPVENMESWHDDYAAAMRAVYSAHDSDADIASLFAEALMNRTPWELWDLKTGKVAEGASTAEAREVIESSMKRLADEGLPPHAGLLHMYIHLMEMSPFPEKALTACDQLRGLVPDSGHLNHMATHIDVMCGDYAEVVASNNAAMVSDRKYLAKEGPLNFYSLYRSHNYHFKIYGAMFLGQYKPAIETAEEMISTLPENLLRVESPPMADWLEAFIPVKQHVFVRFGKWDEILSQEFPENSELYCSTVATMRYARAVAFASKEDVEAAEKEAAEFDEALKRVPDSRYLFNNSCLDILAVAREMMRGEIEYRKGNFNAAFAHLREAVKLDDNMPYDEPWGWMQPARHALGALLLEQGRVEEAAAVYRADLGYDPTLSRACQHPDNVWSLSGYHECLERLGDKSEAAIIKQRLNIALGRTDLPVNASCYCRLSVVG
ncbi:MAG: hypothetical protein OXI87_09580 [Albidovulum sp.]|nr:hypothetical protein [Albidovulum sp.]